MTIKKASETARARAWVWCIQALGITALMGLVSVAQSATVVAPPVVQTSQGGVKGKLVNGVREYLGIPYAAPPVGALRWQSPQSPASWSGTRDGTAFGSRCPQPKSAISAESTNEDCLFLNVHVPDDIGSAKLPVMVWIHGGAFILGSGSDYDMSTLAQKGRAVVVSINYRLGVFGFFRQPELSAQRAPANFGLQDQQAALRWVRSQINRFGGDPARVTIFGESAGGASVCLHLVSPQSSGLFHRAISESGPCKLLTSDTAATAEANATAMGGTLDCAPGAGQLACMRGKAATDVLGASGVTGSMLKAGVHWAPMQDDVTVIDSPMRQVQEGRFNRVPVIFGSNHDEGRFFVATEYHLSNLLPVSGAQFTEAINKAAAGDAAFAAQLAGVYTSKAYGSRDKAFGALVTDELFACNVVRDVEALSRYVPTYHYEFTEAKTPGIIDPYMALGAFHGAELRYLFQAKLPGPTLNVPLSAAQQKLADQMVAYWGQFAATGSPNAASWPQWPAFDGSKASSLALSSLGITAFGTSAFKVDHQCGLWPQP
jgi:para-nitrobenzyl esterase